MLATNTILRERYRIIHQLGHGGMGKETFATTDEQRRAFRREAQLLANLTHPTLPRVMDHFTHGEGQFLVMQFVPGSVIRRLRRERLEMRSRLLKRSIFISASIVFVGLLSFHSSWLSIEGRTSAQDPNATLPSPKKTTTPKKTTPPPNSSSSNMPRARTNQAGIEFVLIPAGSFMMGSSNGSSDEKPAHQVTISQALYIGKYEVTQAQWQSVMGSNPSNFKGDICRLKRSPGTTLSLSSRD